MRVFVMKDNNNEFLIIKIENTTPIELIDFTNTFVALNSQYKRYIAENYKDTDEEIKLYVGELKEGSKIVKILRHASQKLFLEPVLDKFNKHLATQFIAFLEQKIPDLEEKIGRKFTRQENKEIGSILKHNAGDYNSKIYFQNGQGDSIINNHYYSGIESRAITDEAEKNIKLLDNSDNKLFENEVLELCINDSNSIKGKIDNIFEKPIKIICKEELRKEIITDNEKNPFNMYYIVNGEIKKAGEKIVAYHIKNVVEKGLIDEKNEES
jgi:hypothetical protein